MWGASWNERPQDQEMDDLWAGWNTPSHDDTGQPESDMVRRAQEALGTLAQRYDNTLPSPLAERMATYQPMTIALLIEVDADPKKGTLSLPMEGWDPAEDTLEYVWKQSCPHFGDCGVSPDPAEVSFYISGVHVGANTVLAELGLKHDDTVTIRRKSSANEIDDDSLQIVPLEATRPEGPGFDGSGSQERFAFYQTLEESQNVLGRYQPLDAQIEKYTRFLNRFCATCNNSKDRIQECLDSFIPITSLRGGSSAHSALDETQATGAARLQVMRLERDTWELAKDLLILRTTPEKACIVPCLTDSDAVVIAAETWNNDELKRLKLFRDWLERIAASENIPESSHTQMYEHMMWPRTLGRILSSGTHMMHMHTHASSVGSGGRLTALDPDAAVMPVGGGLRGMKLLPLDWEDERDETDLLRSVWHLIRAGSIERAAKLCAERGQPWRACSLNGGFVIDGDTDQLVPNPCKARWMETCAAFGNTLFDGLVHGGGSVEASNFEAAVQATLGGEYSRLATSSPLVEGWEGQAWCTACAAISVLEEQAILSHREKQAKASALFPGTGEQDLRVQRALVDRLRGNVRELLRLPSSAGASMDLTLNDVLDALSHQRKLSGEVSSPLCQVRTALLKGGTALADVIRDVLWRTICDGAEAGGDATTSKDLLRFAAHLVLYLRALYTVDVACVERECQDLLCAYIEHLGEDEKEYERVALYTKFVRPAARRRKVYADFLRKISGAVTPAKLDEQTKLRRKCRQLAYDHFPGDALAILRRVIVDTRNEQNSPLVTNDRQTASHMAQKVDALDWLDSPKHKIELLLQGNSLLRQLLLGECGDAREWPQVAHVITTMNANWNLGQEGLATAHTEAAAREYRAWCMVETSKELVAKWRELLVKGNGTQINDVQAAGFEALTGLRTALTQAGGLLQDEETDTAPAREDMVRARSMNTDDVDDGDNIAAADREEKIEFDRAWEMRKVELAKARKLVVLDLLRQMHIVSHDTGRWCRQYANTVDGWNRAIYHFREAVQVASLVASDDHVLYKQISPEDMKILISEIQRSEVEALRCEEARDIKIKKEQAARLSNTR